MNWWIVILIIFLLVGADKCLTYINLKLVQKNNPQTNPLDIEKNPAAKFFFQKFGILGGSIIFFFITCISLFICLLLLANGLKYITFTASNPYGYALWLITVLYFMVLGNNFYFMFRYAKLI